MGHKHHENEPPIKTPLWKWLVFVLIALGMPMLFMNYRAQQTARAVYQVEPHKNVQQP